MAFMTDTFAAEGTLADKVTALWKAYKENAVRRAVYKQTFRELSNLSTRELNDLGMSRSEIRRIAYESAYVS